MRNNITTVMPYHKTDKLLNLLSSLFCIDCLLDPANNVVHLKIPLFALLFGYLFLRYKSKGKDLGVILTMIILQFISMGCGVIGGIPYDMDMFTQYLTFFLTLLILLWSPHIDLRTPLRVGCALVSIITIFGYVAMAIYPEIEAILYQFATTHDNIFLMSHRSFLGVDFVSFCYKSLPLVAIPAGIALNKLVTGKTGKIIHLLETAFFSFSMFCGGNRALLIALFVIFGAVLYPRLRKSTLFKPIAVTAILFGLYIIWLALTDKEEASNDIKFDHLRSYIEYFDNNFHLIIFGGGAGSMFYSKGFGAMTTITEWTYIELFRMYGVVGLITILTILLRPLKHYKIKLNYIINWKPISIGYIAFLIMCGSNPYLINATGLIAIMYMYSIVNNPVNYYIK